MKLKRIISGGQIGADYAGLAAGRVLKLETGGWAPKGFRTESGLFPQLGTVYGLKEHESSDYPPRTGANVREAGVTLWFGKNDTPGFFCTFGACKDAGKPIYLNPTIEVIRQLANEHEVFNVAGNRSSSNHGIYDRTITILLAALEGMVPKVIQATNAKFP